MLDRFRRARRVGALVLATLLVGGLFGMGGVGQTAASWVDSERVQGSFSAAVIQPPVVHTCTLDPGTLGANPVVTMTWSYPAGSGYSAGYGVAEGALISNLTIALLGQGVSTTGPVGGVYTTVFNASLLAGLLGGSYGLYVRTVDQTTWVSSYAGATASMGLLGANARCAPNPV